MKLFKYSNYKLDISEEALLIKEFRTIWNRDRTENKTKALLELGYIYFLCDPRSDYSYIMDEEDRAKEIIKLEGLPDKWKPDVVVSRAVLVYKQLTTTVSSLAIQSTKEALNKVQIFLKEINLTDTTDKGAMKYPLNMVTAAIKQIPSLLKELSQAEKDLEKELLESSRIKGSTSKKILEDLDD